MFRFLAYWYGFFSARVSIVYMEVLARTGMWPFKMAYAGIMESNSQDVFDLIGSMIKHDSIQYYGNVGAQDGVDAHKRMRQHSKVPYTKFIDLV